MAEKPDPTATSSRKQNILAGFAMLVIAATFMGAWRLGRGLNALDEVKPGDTAPVPIRSSLYDIVDAPEDAEWCVFVQGAQVTAVEVSEKNVLASYRATGTDERECPNDTKFVISKLEFVSFKERYERHKADAADRQELLRRAQER